MDERAQFQERVQEAGLINACAGCACACACNGAATASICLSFLACCWIRDGPGEACAEANEAQTPLFLSPHGKRLHPENLVKRKLKPLLKKLGVYVKGTACHGFRHGAATKLDELRTPLATRQQRMGHVDPDTLMGYTHAVSDDDRKVSAAFGAVLSQGFSKTEPAKDIPEQLSVQLLDSQAAA